MMKIVFLMAGVFAFFYNSISAQYPKMIAVEGGKFVMGDDFFVGFKEEFPLHEVHLTGFSIAETETTVEQWRVYCADVGVAMPSPPAWGWNDQDPICMISWEQALAYTQWLSKKTGKAYNLPTEAQWEYAAKGGSKHQGYKFSGGQWPDALGWFQENSDRRLHPVKQKRPNELGLYDMTGNVAEWCLDWMGDYTKTKKTNPKGAVEGRTKVYRGGCFIFNYRSCRIAYRNATLPNFTGNFIGFRVVCNDE